MGARGRKAADIATPFVRLVAPPQRPRVQLSEVKCPAITKAANGAELRGSIFRPNRSFQTISAISF